MKEIRLILTTCKQLPRDKFFFIHEQESSINTDSFSINNIIFINPDKNLDDSISFFMISKLRKHYIKNLLLCTLILFILQGGKEAILGYFDSLMVDHIEFSLHVLKTLKITFPIVMLIVMILICVNTYKVLTTASRINIMKEIIIKKAA